MKSCLLAVAVFAALNISLGSIGPSILAQSLQKTPQGNLEDIERSSTASPFKQVAQVRDPASPPPEPPPPPPPPSE